MVRHTDETRSETVNMQQNEGYDNIDDDSKMTVGTRMCEWCVY